MKIKAGTELIINIPVHVVVPHEVDSEVLAEALAASLRAQKSSVRGGYYDYQIRGDLINQYEVTDIISMTVGDDT